MLRESDVKNYFEGNISIEVLIDRIQSQEIERNIPEVSNRQNTPRAIKIKYDKEFHDLQTKQFVLTKSHLIQLCNDFLAGRISAWDLEDIAFILYACDGIDWGNDGEERKLIADVMFNFSSPEINYSLTKDYVEKVKDFLFNS
jgi:hypothetical protein